MEILQYCKLQLGALAFLLFITYVFIRDGNRIVKITKKKSCNKYYDNMLFLSYFAVLFDGVTAVTVNYQSVVPGWLNKDVHLIFLCSYQLFIFEHFMYWRSITERISKGKKRNIISYIPITISMILTIAFIPQLYYAEGVTTNYSLGVSAYSCYLTLFFYTIQTLCLFFTRRSYIQSKKRTAFYMSYLVVCIVTVGQAVVPESLISSIAVILIMISIYLNTEDPAMKYVKHYHDEMVMGFATLVEGKDGSTGGHIRRTSAYAALIAKQLRKKPKYRPIITKDFLDVLSKAAPMHDVGKISVPDRVLQKPGRLTEEEFEIIKKHPEDGARIIQETFGHLNDEEFEEMAYNIAKNHHEKWNGRGYPQGLKGEEIPLCARIMAVADVFDAVSADRCYRKAMPLEQCFQIVREGRGEDFAPDVVDAFFACQDGIEKIYHSSM